MLYLDLFWSFLQVGLFSVGGGYAAIPLIQKIVVLPNDWITMQEFSDLITIAEMTPGPIAVNSATFVGFRIAGFAGAVIATLGCITPSLLIVSLLALMYAKYHNLAVFQSILGCLRASVIALIATAGLSILGQAVFSGGTPSLQGIQYIGAVLFGGAFLLLRKYKWNPILVMLLCGAANLILYLAAEHLRSV